MYGTVWNRQKIKPLEYFDDHGHKMTPKQVLPVPFVGPFIINVHRFDRQVIKYGPLKLYYFEHELTVIKRWVINWTQHTSVVLTGLASQVTFTDIDSGP